MSRRANGEHRCEQCRMHQSVCVCSLLPRIETRTRLVLVIHRLEVRKTTNTGRLGAMCLPNSETLVRGHDGTPEPRASWAEGSQPLLLFPFEDAVPLTEYERSDRPITLFVPDGNWRQASKVRKRLPGMASVPCVLLPKAEREPRRLRVESRDDGLATIEAIARAMGILEGPHVEEALLFVFRAMVERTLWTRGDIATEHVTGGIPEGAERHDPRGILARAKV
jgi:DTW domain-containing protein YfiP